MSQPDTAIPARGGAPRPLRILHVLGSMNRGGVETWIMHVLRGIDRDRFRMDFLVHTDQPGAYDPEVLKLGCRILPLPLTGKPLAYAKGLRRVLREQGPFDVVHSHVHAYSGWVLRVAAQEGVPGRVAHSHTDRSNIADERGLRRLAYRGLMRGLVHRYATGGAGVSEATTAAFFGPAWRSDPRWRIIYYGMSFAPFHLPVDRAAVRAELGLPADALVIGHVGNLLPVKNHALLLRTTADIVRRRLAGDVPVRLLLVGQGPLREQLEKQAAELGIGPNVVFAGVRPDVPRLLVGAMDVFAFTSVWEGLPLALVEAQAAGLPVVMSDRVTPEAAVLESMVRRLSPDAPIGVWADACIAAHGADGRLSRRDALERVERSAFNLDACLKELESLYTGRVPPARYPVDPPTSRAAGAPIG